MKNKFKMFGIIVLITVIGFVFPACGGESYGTITLSGTPAVSETLIATSSGDFDPILNYVWRSMDNPDGQPKSISISGNFYSGPLYNELILMPENSKLIDGKYIKVYRYLKDGNVVWSNIVGPVRMSLIIIKTIRSFEFLMDSDTDGIWRVYENEFGSTLYSDITVSFNASTLILTLSHGTKLEPRDYWVTVQEHGEFFESIRMPLTVPEIDYSIYIKNDPIQANVEFPLDSIIDGTWRVYGSETGTELAAGITATFNAPILTLSHATNVSEGEYWVTVKEDDLNFEGARLKLTVKEDE